MSDIEKFYEYVLDKSCKSSYFLGLIYGSLIELAQDPELTIADQDKLLNIIDRAKDGINKIYYEERELDE